MAANYLRKMVEDCLAECRRGQSERTFHNLIEEPECEIVPLLLDAYEHESSMHVRSELLRVLAYFRSVAALPLLETNLNDRTKGGGLWKAALSHLVAYGSPAAAKIIIQAMTVERRRVKPDTDYLAWLREAHQQTVEAFSEHTSDC